MFKQILFCTDFSDASARAEACALELAKLAHGRVVAFHAIEALDPSLDFKDFYERLTRHANEKMADVKARFTKGGIECTTHVAIGQRWREILEAARLERCDLIVLGSGHPRTGPNAIVPGTTAHKVFLASPIALFVVP